MVIPIVKKAKISEKLLLSCPVLSSTAGEPGRSTGGNDRTPNGVDPHPIKKRGSPRGLKASFVLVEFVHVTSIIF